MTTKFLSFSIFVTVKLIKVIQLYMSLVLPTIMKIFNETSVKNPVERIYLTLVKRK